MIEKIFSNESSKNQLSSASWLDEEKILYILANIFYDYIKQLKKQYENSTIKSAHAYHHKIDNKQGNDLRMRNNQFIFQANQQTSLKFQQNLNPKSIPNSQHIFLKPQFYSSMPSWHETDFNNFSSRPSYIGWNFF